MTLVVGALWLIASILYLVVTIIDYCILRKEIVEERDFFESQVKLQQIKARETIQSCRQGED